MRTVVRLLAVCLAALMLSGAAEAARVPAGVGSIRFHSATGITTIVRRPAAVGKIVKWFDALPQFVARPCPYPIYQPPDVRFVFRDAAGGAVLRAVDHLPGTCPGSINYSNDGQVKYAPLADDNFVARVSKLIGVDVDPSARTAANERSAKSDAAHLLRLALVPAGSRRVGKPLRKRLESPATRPGAPSLVELHRLWEVHEPMDTIVKFERAHAPRGSKLLATGSSTLDGKTVAEQVTFSFPPLGQKISLRWLNVNVVPLGGGWTGIRVDAQDVWIVARLPNEVVPSGVKQVVFQSHRITGRVKIAKIVRWFDALPIVQPGAGFSCPMLVYGPAVQLDFRGASGTVLARARMVTRFHAGGLLSTPCTPIEFTIGGRRQTPLVGGQFFSRVKRLAR